MRRLIEGLLELARQGRQLGETTPVSLADAAEVAWGSVDGDGADLRIERSPPTVLADRDRLSQLFENLFSNAFEHSSTNPASQARQDVDEYSSTDPDARTAGDDTPTVTVGSLPDEDGFFIADDGPGIPAEERDRVFESGYTTAEDGTGFGLAIVRSIAQAHGWSVSLTESEAGGARFEFSDVERVD
jgi:signal transduction histidine kinase